MASSTPTKLLISTIVLSMLALGCFVAGLIGSVWWIIEKTDSKTVQGLWKKCIESQNETVCTTRNGILEFKEDKGFDPIMICLLISTFLIILSITTSISMLCCCNMNPDTWYKSAKWTVLLAVIAFITSVDAMVYTEIQFKYTLQNSKRGWSYMISWAGTGLHTITFILTLILLCVKQRPLMNGMHGW